jgi:DNA-binding transcriptional ArsR family regulator
MIELREARPVARMLAGLSDPSRLMIALCLLQRPHYVGELSEILRIPVVNVSHHLGVLKQAGLVEDTREGRRVLYRLREEVLDATSGPSPQTVLNLGPYRLWITEPPPVQPMEWPRGRGRGRPRRHKRPSGRQSKRSPKE